MTQKTSCELAMDVCYSSHSLVRCFQQTEHTVRLLPAQQATPFGRGNKSDHNVSIAIAEASKKANISDVPLKFKSIAHQDIQYSHRMRDICVAKRTGLMNQFAREFAVWLSLAPERFSECGR